MVLRFFNENATVQMLYKEAAFNHSVALKDAVTGQVAVDFVFHDWTVNVPGNKHSLDSGSYDFFLNTMVGASFDRQFQLDPVLNHDGLIHMIMLDLSWYYDEPAFMVAFEDMYKGSIYGDSDWDFNDGIYVFRSVEAQTENGGSAVPEPATAVIFGLGVVGLPLLRRLRKSRISTAT